MPAQRWRKADESFTLKHCLNHEGKSIFYARTYTIGQGYSYSVTNNLIINIKHAPNSGSKQTHHKKSAIRKFAQELASFFNFYHSVPFAIIPIPPSKTRKHPLFDDRLEQVANEVAYLCSNVIASPILEGITDMATYHSGAERSAQKCYASMRVISDSQYEELPHRILAIMDDVLTSGAHYEAARQHLLSQFPSAQIIGMFWAKSVTVQNQDL